LPRLDFLKIFSTGVIEGSQMADKKSKKLSNTEEEYNDALATTDPTKIDNVDLEKLAKEAMKKFKSLS